MPEKMLFYDADGNSVRSVDHAVSFVRLVLDDAGNVLQEDIGSVGDGVAEEHKSIMPPSALDRLPYLNFNIEKEEKARDYEQEYRDYHGKPEQIKERAQRNAARRKLGLKRGDGKEADHKNPISNGGSNNSNNLRAVSRDTNRKKGASTK